MAGSPPPPGAHLASLLQGLAGAGSPPPPSPSGGMNDPNGLLRMLAGGPANPLVHSPPPPPQASSPASPAQPMSLLDLLNQRPSSQQQRPSVPSPARSNGGEPSPLAVRPDVSQAGSPGGRLGGTSLMEMLMGGLPMASSGETPPVQRETLSPPPSTSMNPLLSAQQQRSTRPNGYGLVDTGFTSPSPPPSEARALRIEPQSPVVQAPVEPAELVEPDQSAPNPSMFSFISPFDAAFGPPAGKRSKSVQPSSKTAVSLGSVPSSALAAAGQAPPRSTSFHGAPLQAAAGSATEGKLAPNLFPSALTPPTPTPLATAPVAHIVRASSPQPPTSPARSRTSNASAPIAADSPLGHTRTSSGNLRVKKADVYPSGKWRTKTLQKSGLAGRAEVPDRLRNAPIDISKPNLETLVADPGALTKRPISIIRSDLVYLPGRTVDGSTFISYAMNKGRVRLIDEASGARALLKLPSDWYKRDAQVADLATQNGLVAAITTDGGLVVWRVPASWSEDDPECALVCATGPSDQDDRRLARLRWVSPARLAVCSPSAVWIVEVERSSEGWTCDRPLELEAFERQGSAVRIAGRSIVDFSVHPTPNGGTQVAVVASDGSLGLHIVSASAGAQAFWHGPLTNDVPSSIELLDSDLLLLGTERGTVLRLFSLATDASGRPDVSEPLDEVRFEAPDATAVFAKIEVDRLRDLVWVSNTARCSLYALRLDRGLTAGSRPLFGRAVEFALDDPVTSFVVKATDADVFVVSPSGVDMLTFSADALDRLLHSAAPAVPTPVATPARQPEVVKEATRPALVEPAPPPTSAPVAAVAPEPTSAPRGQSNGATPNAAKVTAGVSEGDLGRAVRKELAQVEESLIRRFSSSLQLQSERLETADLRRQEKIFAVLAQELGTNHSALVTETVKAELHAAVLPALSTLVRAEVRSVLQQEVARGVAEAISSRTVFLSIDKAVKDLATKTLIPSFDGATAAMGATLTQEIREDMTGIRKEIVREQSGALVETNDLLSEMTTQIRALSKQVAELQGTVVSLQQHVVAIPQHPRQRSPVVSPVKPVEAYPPPPPSTHSQQHQLQQPYPPTGGQALPSFTSAPFGNPPQRSPLVQPMQIHPASLAYPQPIGPGPGGPPPFSPSNATYSPAPVIDWGDAFTEAFLSADPAALAHLTRRIGPNLDAVLPDVPPGSRPAGPEGRGPLSQAVLLTTVHKFTESLSRASANTADFASAVVVIARASRLLDTTDPTIVPYAHRVITQVVPALARTEADLVQAAAGAAGPPGSAGERTRLFFADGLRGARAELQSKASLI